MLSEGFGGSETTAGEPRFFPVADGLGGFQALLAESCMDGTLRSHVAMVENCRPFQDSDGDEGIDRIRRELGYLLEWDTALESGAVMGAWATVEPQVHATAPAVFGSPAAAPCALGEGEVFLALSADLLPVAGTTCPRRQAPTQSPRR